MYSPKTSWSKTTGPAWIAGGGELSDLEEIVPSILELGHATGRIVFGGQISDGEAVFLLKARQLAKILNECGWRVKKVKFPVQKTGVFWHVFVNIS